MPGSLQLWTIRGIPVRVHVTLLIVFALLVMHFGSFGVPSLGLSTPPSASVLNRPELATPGSVVAMKSATAAASMRNRFDINQQPCSGDGDTGAHLLSVRAQNA